MLGLPKGLLKMSAKNDLQRIAAKLIPYAVAFLEAREQGDVDALTIEAMFDVCNNSKYALLAEKLANTTIDPLVDDWISKHKAKETGDNILVDAEFDYTYDTAPIS
jgi:hypothetical protein